MRGLCRPYEKNLKGNTWGTSWGTLRNFKTDKPGKKKKKKNRTFGECLANMLREQREHSWSFESLLHAVGRYAPKSDSTPLRQSQNWESPYLFSSHQINNNIRLWTKTLSVSLCLLVSFPASDLPLPPPPPSLALSLSVPWQLFVSLLLSSSTCLQLLTQPEASSFFPPLWIIISPPRSVVAAFFRLTCVVWKPHICNVFRN